MLEKTLESPLDCKEIQPVHPKGDQSWVFIGRAEAEAETPVLWPPHDGDIDDEDDVMKKMKLIIALKIILLLLLMTFNKYEMTIC